MYERMLNKEIIPTEDSIKEFIGEKAVKNMGLLKKSLEKIIEINTELRFPYGNKYGWGYKFTNGKKKHLFDLFFERGWIHYRVKNRKHLKDIGIFLSIKTEKEIKIY